MKFNFYNKGDLRFELTDDILVDNTGLGFIGQLLSQADFNLTVNGDSIPHGNQTLETSDILRTMIAIIAQGDLSYEEVEKLRGNPSFGYLMQLKNVPSESALRQRLDELGMESTFHEKLFDVSQQAIKQLATLPIMDQINQKLQVPGKKTRQNHWLPLNKAFIPLDIDVTPFDNSNSQKEGVSWTYKGFDGFAPNYAYLSTEGYIVHSELREGSEHVQKGTAPFLTQAINRSKVLTDQPICVRMDAGNDSEANLTICETAGVDYLIKRNRRRRPLESFLEEAQTLGVDPVIEREGKYVYDFLTEENGFRTAVRVTERWSDTDGNIYLIPAIEVEHYWTSLDEPVSTLILLYHNHAICEQYHSELKHDLDVERLPSSKFKTNALILTLISLTYNLLRLIGQTNHHSSITGYRPSARPARIRMKTILKRLIFFSSKMVTSARQTVFKLSCYFVRGPSIIKLRQLLE